MMFESTKSVKKIPHNTSKATMTLATPNVLVASVSSNQSMVSKRTTEIESGKKKRRARLTLTTASISLSSKIEDELIGVPQPRMLLPLKSRNGAAFTRHHRNVNILESSTDSNNNNDHTLRIGDSAASLRPFLMPLSPNSPVSPKRLVVESYTAPLQLPRQPVGSSRKY